jgi:hypothetical protein
MTSNPSWSVIVVTNEGGVGRRVEQLNFNTEKTAKGAAMWLKKIGKTDLNIAIFDNRETSEGQYIELKKADGQ